MEQFKAAAVMHPAHLEYISKTPRFCSLKQFFLLTDSLEPDDCDRVLAWAYYTISDPQSVNPVVGLETGRGLLTDKVSYAVFKNKCFALAEFVNEYFLVWSIVNLSLQCSFSIGNTPQTSNNQPDFERSLEYTNLILHKRRGEPVAERDRELTERLEPSYNHFDEQGLADLQVFIQAQLAALSGQLKGNQVYYQQFCEKVVVKLNKF